MVFNVSQAVPYYRRQWPQTLKVKSVGTNTSANPTSPDGGY